MGSIFTPHWRTPFINEVISNAVLINFTFVIGVLALLALWFKRGVYGKCTKCQRPFSWSEARLVPDCSDPEEKEEKWKRSNDGATATAWVRWPAKLQWQCPGCQELNTQSTWRSTGWLRDGDGRPFPVEDCPMCAGKGYNDIRNNRARTMRTVDCGFCKCEGYVSATKLNRFRLDHE